MPDYGHDLRLGAFLTPQSRRPQDVVALAQLSEVSSSTRAPGRFASIPAPVGVKWPESCSRTAWA